MMKRLFCFLSLFLAAACGKGQEPAGKVEDSIVLSSAESYSMAAKGESVTITFSSSGNWTSSVSADWISLTPASGGAGRCEAILRASANPSSEGRQATLTIRTGSASGAVSVSQDGSIPDIFEADVHDRKAPSGGESFSVAVNTNMELSIEVPSWVSATRSTEGYDFVVSSNETSGSRTGTVTISTPVSSKKASFVIKQKSVYSLYILAIGNSFSWDAMEYLYQILRDLGYKDIFLGNLYIGGCTLQTHAGNLNNYSSAYEYRTNNSGSWSSKKDFAANAALRERDWDFVSMQQASGSSGMPDTYEPYLSTIIEKVKAYCPDARLMWHMTWAYQGNSTHSEFSKYGKDQMTMYNAIVNCVKTKVLAHDEVSFVIPCGTAVQNMRTSFYGDNLTRDGYHMSYDVGRLLTGLMWARQITGKSIAELSYKPSSYSYSDKLISAIKEAVQSAYDAPYEVSQSSYPGNGGTAPETPEEILVSQGYNPADYTVLDLQLTHNAYWNSTEKSTIISAATGSTASNLNQFAATRMFTKSEIPEGSLLVLKSGFQYRPEGWTSLSSKNSSSTRPGNVSSQFVAVTSSWWGNWNYRAFNLAKLGNPGLDAAGQAELDSCFFIFVPKGK